MTPAEFVVEARRVTTILLATDHTDEAAVERALGSLEGAFGVAIGHAVDDVAARAPASDEALAVFGAIQRVLETANDLLLRQDS